MIVPEQLVKRLMISSAVILKAMVDVMEGSRLCSANTAKNHVTYVVVSIVTYHKIFYTYIIIHIRII